MVGLVLFQQTVDDLPVAVHATGLEEGPLVPVEAEPGHTVEDDLNGGLGGAFTIGVLDAQQELALVLSRLQPAVESGADAADVQVAGRARGKARADGHDSFRDIEGADSSRRRHR